jgi:diguanylate cyclase (GGDEF)-like protein
MPQPDAAAPASTDDAAPQILRLVQAPPLPAGGTSIPILAFPLLTGLWLILAARLATVAWRQRNRRIQRLASALNLEAGVARELTNLPPTALSRLEERLEAVAFDDMTGVLRRGPGLAALEREVARADRTGTALTIAFVDIDGLKQVNDNQGHAAGDALIKAVAAALERRLRAADLVFRYGGDEFVCVLPDAQREHAVRVLDTIQRDAWSVGARFSFGVAAYRDGDTVEDLLERADARLYESRQGEREPLRLIRPA